MFSKPQRRPSKLLRRLKQAALSSNYAAQGLNGTKAQARRLRQIAKRGQPTQELMSLIALHDDVTSSSNQGGNNG